MSIRLPFLLCLAFSSTAAAEARPSSAEASQRRRTIPALVSHGNDTLRLTSVRFGDMPGWRGDHHADALPAFLASCGKLAHLSDNTPVGVGPFGGRVKNWKKACRRAQQIPQGNHQKARVFFEKEFRAFAAQGKKGRRGRLTGYYVQPINGSRIRHGKYQFPLYSRPSDLVAASLSEFVRDGRDRRIWGKLGPLDHKLIPYPTRQEFRLARSGQSAHVLLWLDNPRDVVRVEIEGSGKATMDDGTTMMVAFAGKNARKSGKLRIVAKELKELAAAHTKGGVWSDTEITRYHEITDQKTSMVFFEMEARSGAIGTQNVVLTPRRSLAVDRAVIPLSTPVWVSTKAPKTSTARHTNFRQLLIAQDTGGAIRGTVRGDIYWGDDAEALAIGKRVNGPGRMWLLLPRELPLPAP